MANETTHEPHCRFCMNVAVARQKDGSWVCQKHEHYTPWGAAVLAHSLGFGSAYKEQPVAQK